MDSLAPIQHAISQSYGEIIPHNVAMETVFQKNFCDMRNIDSIDHFSILLTSKTWNKILTSSLCKILQHMMPGFMNAIVSECGFAKMSENVNYLTKFNGGMTFKELNINSLFHQRSIQESFYEEKCFALSNLEIAFQNASDLTLVTKKQFFDVFCNAKSEEEIKQRLSVHLDVFAVNEIMKHMKTLLAFNGFEKDKNRCFQRFAENPYSEHEGGSRLIYNKNLPLFSDMRFGMLSSDFATRKEKSLLLSAISEEEFTSMFQTLFVDWENHAYTIERLLSKVCLSKYHFGVKDFVLSTAQTQAEKFAKVGNSKSLYQMQNYFKHGRHLEYREICFNFQLQKALQDFTFKKMLKLREQTLNSDIQHPMYLKALFKIADSSLNLGRVNEAVKTILMIPAQRSTPPVEWPEELLNSLFTTHFFDKLFTHVILSWKHDMEVLEEKKGFLEKLFSKSLDYHYAFNLFQHLHALLRFRYNSLEAVFAVDGLHCSFIKACVKSDSVATAQAFIEDGAIVDALEASNAQEIKSFLLQYLQSL